MSKGSTSEEGSGRTARTGVAAETPEEREFWERYWEVLRVKGVKAGQERWYERSCAQFIRVWKPLRRTSSAPGNGPAGVSSTNVAAVSHTNVTCTASPRDSAVTRRPASGSNRVSRRRQSFLTLDNLSDLRQEPAINPGALEDLIHREPRAQGVPDKEDAIGVWHT